MGEVVTFPHAWRFDGDRFALTNGCGSRVLMRQRPEIWKPIWVRDGECLTLSAWRAGPLPAGGFRSEQEHQDWNKQLGPTCSLFPPSEWSVLMPPELARDVAHEVASALVFFSRTFRCTDGSPRRIVPLEKVVFEGQLARFNGK